MARIRIDCPDNFSFSCQIPIRINDINYGGHVGNDSLLSLVLEILIVLYIQWFFTNVDKTLLLYRSNGH